MLKKSYQLIILISLGLFIIFPRILNLDVWHAPDEDRWLGRTNNFTNELAHGNLDSLLQVSTPGITVHWLGATTIHNDSWAVRKSSIVVGQIIIIMIIGYLLFRLWGFNTAVIGTIIIASNPLTYALTRIYGTDSLMSLSLILSILSLLLWQKKQEYRYLAFSSFTAAFAILSKVSGIIILPFISLLFAWNFLQFPTKKKIVKAYLSWILLFLISLGIIFPSLFINPINAIKNILTMFDSNGYKTLHSSTYWYYFKSLFFFSTPTHFILILALPITWLLVIKRKIKTKISNKQLLIFILFAVLFFTQMTIGAKKGHRYILPTFISLDLIATITISWLINVYTHNKKQYIATIFLSVFAFSTLWQNATIWRLHPHVMAYTNPLTKSLVKDLRYGWGEGLDLAANYLNRKPNAKNITIASYYPKEFANYSVGNVIPVHRHDEASVNYVVLYRAMLERGEDAWETDVLNQYKNKTPEKIIYLDNIKFAWIYKK